MIFFGVSFVSFIDFKLCYEKVITLNENFVLISFLSFLRMRNFDVMKAKQMFLNMLKWREEKGVDAIAKV